MHDIIAKEEAEGVGSRRESRSMRSLGDTVVEEVDPRQINVDEGDETEEDKEDGKLGQPLRFLCERCANSMAGENQRG